jgi:prepilin-type processing-associated H-X9-DG protein
MLSLSVVGVLLALLFPALEAGRAASHRQACAGNLRVLGGAWQSCIDANDGRFPVVPVQPAWRYGGVRFSAAHGRAPFLDLERPLNRFVPLEHLPHADHLFACPADTGITDAGHGLGTGRRSAFEAFGTSYRANAQLLSGRSEGRAGLARNQITTAPSRLVVMGDAVWYEQRESTGRRADWHGTPGAGNMLFLDGSVKFVTITTAPQVGPAVFDPMASELVFPR